MTDWLSRHGEDFSDASVLVTGGAGFIGSHLVEALLTLGGEVRVLDDLSGGSRANVTAAEAGAGGEARFIQGSITDESTLAEAIAGCRYVFHQAALGSVPMSVAEPQRFHRVNDGGTFQVLDAARQAGVSRVIFAASSSAYGHTATLPKAETMPARPLSPYAASKTAGEAWVRAYTNSYELDAVSLRYFNIFGPRQNANSAYAAVIAAFAKALRRNEQAWIHGDGEQSRDFTYVENAIEANLLAARAAGPLQGEVLNVGCGERITVTELFHLMRRLAGQGESMMPEYGQARAGDVRHSLADLTQIDQTLGYAPIVPITAGLEQTLAWYRQSLGEPAEAKADSGTSE